MRDQSEVMLSRREVIVGGMVFGMFLMRPNMLNAASIDASAKVDPQPYFAHAKRLIEAMRLVGEPLRPEHEAQILSLSETPTAGNVRAAEEIFEHYTLMHIRLDERGIGQSTPGNAQRELIEQGWRSFLVRVENPFGLQRALALDANTVSGSVVAEGELAYRLNLSTETSYLVQARMAEPADVAKKWMGYQFFTKRPMDSELYGLGLEYQVLQLYSRDRGPKSAYLDAQSVGVPFAIAYGEKRGFEATFDCLPSRDVALEIRDWDAAGTTASLIICDDVGRLYPAPAHRLEPDFDFQPQIYRADGESVKLPAGHYTVTVWRGPEYLKKTQEFIVDDSSTTPWFGVRLERWINPAALGWYPGDTHLHAAGCAHYEVPTMGVTPESMIRHVRGEGLTVGNVLTWGPGYYYQKRFFTGHIHEPTNALEHPEFQKSNNTSLKPNATPHDRESMVRWDLEISGFPSSHSGHLVLLGLKDQDYPGAKRLENWPSWNLPILKWARDQGAIVGYAHCGLMVDSTELPNYELPPFDLVGANEYLVDITHDAVDFVSGTNCHPVAELNFWYHVLNCGFRTPMVGETDFPCLWERAGNGRSYVGLDQPPVGDEGFAAWVDGIKRGRLYFGDGRSHFIGYRLNGRPVGSDELKLSAAGKVTLTAQIAARLEEVPIAVGDDQWTPAYSYWHLERARIGRTRTVSLEVIVNGRPVATREILADGKLRDLSIDIELEQSAWVALRIFPSGHTTPMFVTVAGRPIRASRRSAQWCLDCIDVLWQEKAHRIRPSERQQARAAYEHARAVYRRLRSECLQD